MKPATKEKTKVIEKEPEPEVKNEPETAVPVITFKDLYESDITEKRIEVPDFP